MIGQILDQGTGDGNGVSGLPAPHLNPSWRQRHGVTKQVGMASNQKKAGLDVRMKFFTIMFGRHWHKFVRQC